VKRTLGLALVACRLVFPQEFSEVQAERAATGLVYADGIAWSRGGFLVFADIGKKKIYRLDPGGTPKPTNEDVNGAQGLAFDSSGRLYICEPLTRRVTRLDHTGKLEVVAETFEGRKLNAPNDVVVRHDGQIYFTDPAFASEIDRRELDFNGIFHVTPKGEIEALARWKTRPNGIALSADGKILYVSDSDRHAVVAFDLDGRGVASNPRDAIRKIEGVPNGLRTDVKGRIYVAARGLGVYGADGRLVHTFLPGEIVTNCAFGDNDFETLYASAPKTVFRLRLGVKGAIPY
jgi:gluconolactonase